MFRYILDKIKASIVRRASANKMIDIVEVRTKEIGLTQVTTETDIRIKNAFFLPITILSIKTDLLNRDGLKVGSMSYENPQRIKGKSDAVLTTISQISIITSLFQALSSLLAQHIMMHSVGVARVKFLWWVFEIPVDDFFEIHPNKLKIVKEETEEERIARKQKEAEWKEKYDVIKEQKKIEREEKRAQWKEDVLKRRYKENYIPKAERIEKNETDNESTEAEKTDNVRLVLEEEVILQMAEEQTSTVSTDTDIEIAEENKEIKPATDSDNI